MDGQDAIRILEPQIKAVSHSLNTFLGDQCLTLPTTSYHQGSSFGSIKLTVESNDLTYIGESGQVLCITDQQNRAATIYCGDVWSAGSSFNFGRTSSDDSFLVFTIIDQANPTIKYDYYVTINSYGSVTWTCKQRF